MIELNILRSLLLDDKKLAIQTTKKYGLVKCLQLVSKSKVRNNYLRLIRSLEKSIDATVNEIEHKYSLISFEAENLSHKLNSYGINHVFFKGVPLSKLFYKYNSDRIFNDFDVLIDTNNLSSFYEFLEENSFNHRNNHRYINRSGYTRTALEVISSKSGNIYDFHHRIISKFLANECMLSQGAFKDIKNIKGINIPSLNILITSSLYHCFKQNNNQFEPQIFLDLHHLTNKKYDHDKAISQLKKFNLNLQFEKFLFYEDRIKSGIESNEIIEFSKEIFKKERQSKKSFISKNIIRTQIAHLFDPEPYVNYSGGNVKKNIFLELFRMKMKRKKLRGI
tara:strand:+ start:9934 stop:10941 length:1008 start_codon:yes stop_codon:yes gene_type:complete